MELELTMLGHTALICFIYFLWWHKPLNVDIPLSLHVKHADGRAGLEVNNEVNNGDSSSLELPAAPSMMMASTFSPRPTLNDCQLSWRIRLGDYFYGADLFQIQTNSVIRDLLANTFMFLISGIFRIIHCLAWNSHFPSRAEQILLRVAALVVTLCPWFASFLYHWVSKVGLLDIAKGVRYAGVLYGCARLCLLTIAFLSLRNLPFAAY
jgi:hypothetical protein